MDRFLHTYEVTKTKADINTLKNPITGNEIEAVIKKNYQLRKAQDSGFTAECYGNFRDHLMLIVLKHFNEPEKEAVLQKSFLEACITLIPKPEKDPIKKIELRIIQKIIHFD